MSNSTTHFCQANLHRNRKSEEAWRLRCREPIAMYSKLETRTQNSISGPAGEKSFWPLCHHACSQFFFCGRSAMLRPSVHMSPGIGWCGAGLPPFPTACWLTHPAAITGVSVSARWDSPGGCGGPSVPLLCNCRVQRPWCQFASGALAGQSVLFTANDVWFSQTLVFAAVKRQPLCIVRLWNLVSYSQQSLDCV